MQTEALYYKNPLLREFDATVLSCREVRGGYEIVTDATAFYPEGGGQPCDLGTLGNARVLDVQEQEGQIVHLCDRPLEEGSSVHGAIDWEHRFDLMQQHTGEHMVSGVIHALYGCHNVGFHMGADVLQIDFDTVIQADALPMIEDRVNAAIWADLPVTCWVPEPEELAALSYRTKKALEYPVRIVRIGEVDTCACCGVHTVTTGQVGLVKLLSCIKFHAGVRIELVCGGRAMEYLRRIWQQNQQISRLLSAKPLETASAVQRLSDQLTQEKFRATGLQKQLFAAQAAGYAGQGNVLHACEAAADLRELAQQIARQCTGIAAVYAALEEGCRICLARPGSDIRALGQLLHQKLGGKGGGKDGFHQGTVTADEAQLREFFREQWGIL